MEVFDVRNELSPKELAEAVGASESSVKRWVDEGKLEGVRTAGGHRRVALHEALRFVRDTNLLLEKPELLGVPDLTAQTLKTVRDGEGGHALHQSLAKADAVRSRGLIMAFHVLSRSFASVWDGPIMYALNRIAESTQLSGNSFGSEFLAKEICFVALQQVRQCLRGGQHDAPVAVGAAAESEPHQLGTLMAATAVRDAGLRDINLGANTTPADLRDAIAEHRPALVWISAESEEGRTKLWNSIDSLAEQLAAVGGRLAVCGPASVGRNRSTNADFCTVASMSELSTLAGALRVAPATNSSITEPRRVHAPVA